MEEKKQLFRQRSLDRISSPEELNDYLRVTNPPMWMILSAVILVLAGFFVWSLSGSLKTTMPAKAQVKDGMATVVTDSRDAVIEVGMELAIGSRNTKIETVSVDQNGNMTASADILIPDGEYDAEIVTENIRPIDFLFPKKGGL